MSETVTGGQPPAQEPSNEEELKKYRPADIAVGGHDDCFALDEDEAKIWKATSQQEVEAYQALMQNEAFLAHINPMLTSIANPASKSKKDTAQICLANQLAGFNRPCIMDVKMGIRSYTDDAAPEKQARMQARDAATTTAKVGMRLQGLRKHLGDGSCLQRESHLYGRGLDPEGLAAEIVAFFSTTQDSKDIDCDALRASLEQVQDLHRLMSAQTSFRFIGSSLLFVREGQAAEEPTAAAKVKMIDFAHTTAGVEAIDDGYVFGLEHLENILRQALDEACKKDPVESMETGPVPASKKRGREGCCLQSCLLEGGLHRVLPS